MSLVGAVASWLGRKLGLLVLIIVILVAGSYIQGSIAALRESYAAIPKLEAIQAGAQMWVAGQVTETADRVRRLQDAGAERVQERLATVDAETLALSSQPAFPRSTIEIVASAAQGDLDRAVKAKANLELLGHERAFLMQVLDGYAAARDLEGARIELARLLLAHTSAWRALQQNSDQQQRVMAQNPFTHGIWLTPAFRELESLRRQFKTLWDVNQQAYDAYMSQRRSVELLAVLRPALHFAIAPASLQGLLKPLEGTISELTQKRDADWLTRLHRYIGPFLPTALILLVAITLTPLAIKALLYFVAAPLAGRRPALCVLPGASGSIGTAGAPSAVAQTFNLHAANELLVRGDCLQSTSRAGHKRTKWLLNASYPFTSIASGMFALTRVRSDANEIAVVSSTKDPLSEVSGVELFSGSAVVLQPQHLVGVVQQRDQPIAVTSHWRLTSLHAWLTLQFRYLVFHGPGVLVVKGCRGVRVRRPEPGRNINQAATIGFSANLRYSTTRCETFVSYVSGQKALFNDSFSGGDGYYIYQEMPRSEEVTGVSGRWFEGALDAFLKPFGI